MKVPEEIFDILPQVDNILEHRGLGAQFSSFQNNSKFSLSITFKINHDAYYEDKLLIINDKKLNYDNIGDMVLLNYGSTGKLSDVTLTHTFTEAMMPTNMAEMENQLLEAFAQVKDGNIPPAEDCPEPTKEDIQTINDANIKTIDIKNSDGVVIQTVTANLENNSIVCDNVSGLSKTLKASFLNSLPTIDPGNNIEPTVADPICALPDSSLKDTLKIKQQELNLSTETIASYNEDLLNSPSGLTTIVQNQLKVLNSRTGSEDVVDPDTIKEIVEDITKNTSPKFGIPLVTINPNQNIIIQIQNDQIEVLNIDKIPSRSDGIIEKPTDDENLNNSIPDIGKNKLIIPASDLKILPEVVYVLVYTRNNNFHKLEVKKLYDDETFSNEIISPADTGVYYLGMDKSGLKQFCGIFYDVHLAKDEIDINGVSFNQDSLPTQYGALAYYDFYNKNEDDTRVIHNRAYAYKSVGKPLAIRGKHWFLEDRLNGNYTFPNHCYIDDMFCKNKFTNKSFAVILYFKKNAKMNEEKYDSFNKEYVPNKQVFLSDPVNNNLFYYDEIEMTFNIDFHGYKDILDINIVPDKWYQLSIRYNYEEQLLTTDIYCKNLLGLDKFAYLDNSSTTKISKTTLLDGDLETARKKLFMINSLYGEYSFEDKEYQYLFDTVVGPIALFDNKLYDSTVNNFFEGFYPVLNNYKEIGSDNTEFGILPNYE